MVKKDNDGIIKKTETVFKDLYNVSETYRRRTVKLVTYESLDFEQPDGDHMRVQFKKRSWRKKALVDGLGYGLTAMVGIVVGGLYLLIHVGIEIFAQWRRDLLERYLIQEHDLGFAWAVATGTCLLFALTGALLVFYEPSASASGMPEVIAYLNGVNLSKHSTIRALIFKVLTLICLVSSGLFSGYDGPMALLGLLSAVLAINLVLKSSTASRYFFGESQELVMDDKADLVNVLHLTHKRQALVFAAAGSAAGMTTAFHAPLGGTVFALEEAVSFFTPALIVRTLFACIISYFVIGYFGNVQYIGMPIESNLYALFPYEATCTSSIAFEDIFSYVALGIMAGISGAVYNELISFVVGLRVKYLFSRPYLRLLEVVLICVLTSTVVVFAPQGGFNVCSPAEKAVDHLVLQLSMCSVNCSNVADPDLLNNCLDNICLPTTTKSIYEKLYIETIADIGNQCTQNSNASLPLVDLGKLASQLVLPDTLVTGDNCYYQLASLLFVSPTKVLQNLILRGANNLFDTSTLAVFAVLYLFVSVLTYNIMLPSDLVIPNLIFGATMGRLFGIFVNVCKKAVGTQLIDPANFALMGASAFWSGTSRIMLTIAVIMVETTLDLSQLIGIILSVLTATIVGNWFGESLFHMEIHLKGYPYLPDSTPPAINQMRVMDIMSRNLVVLQPNQTAKEIFAKLASCSHQGFPVVREMPSVDIQQSSSAGSLQALISRYKLVGFVLRSQLKEKFMVTVHVNEKDAQIINGTLTKESAIKALDALKKAESENLQIDVELKQLKDLRYQEIYASSLASNNSDYQSELDNDETLIDLTKIMNHPPHVVHRQMSLIKAYRMFRHMGLRHLCVVDEDMCLVGIVTRKDFFWAFEKHEHGSGFDSSETDEPKFLSKEHFS